MTPDPSNAEVAKDAAQSGQLPPLRVHHMLLWMAVTAVMLAGARLVARYLAEMESLADAPMVAVGVVACLIFASGCIVITFLWWRRRQECTLEEPGQRFAEDVAVNTTLVAAMLLLALIAINRAAVLVLIIGVAGNIPLNIVLGNSLAAPWRHVFYLKAAQWAGATMLLAGQDQNSDRLHFLPIIFVATGVVLIVPQFIGIYMERRRKLSRQWTHWFGLVAHLAINFMSVAFVILALSSFTFVF
jgi:hypothetical protein